MRKLATRKTSFRFAVGGHCCPYIADRSAAGLAESGAHENTCARGVVPTRSATDVFRASTAPAPALGSCEDDRAAGTALTIQIVANQSSEALQKTSCVIHEGPGVVKTPRCAG